MEYVTKTPQQQAKDIQDLALYQRIDPYSYFHYLQLTNKLEGVTEYSQVNEADRIFSAIRYRELQVAPIEGNFDKEHLCKIHEYLFQDIYYFAGKFRDVNMEIDSVTRFTPARRLSSEAERIFGELKKDNYLKNLDKEKFVDKLASFMTELNKLHPFREGNGRSKRVFVGQLAQEAGWELNWSAVEPKEWKFADECAFDSARDYGAPDLTYLKHNLNKTLTPINAATHRHVTLSEFLSENTKCANLKNENINE